MDVRRGPARPGLALLALVAACAETRELPPPAAAPPPAATVPKRALSIAVVGSSTAAGFGLADPATSWVGRYATYLAEAYPGSRVENFAVPGYTTFQVLPTGTVNPASRPPVDEAHNITAALAVHPDAILVNLPSNDAAKSVPVEVTMRNLGVVVSTAKDAGVAVWLSTSQPRTLDAQGRSLLSGLRSRMSAEFGARAIDFYAPLAAPDGTPLPIYNQGDGIHPNAEGHRLLFEQVKRADIPSQLTARP